MLPQVIYIASPYTNGDKEANVRAQIEAGHAIMDLGHAPIVPNLTHFMQLWRDRPYEDWMARDFAIIKRCDCVLRLPGYSPGADREVMLAKELGLRVCYSLDELKQWLVHKKAEETRILYPE